MKFSNRKFVLPNRVHCKAPTTAISSQQNQSQLEIEKSNWKVKTRNCIKCCSRYLAPTTHVDSNLNSHAIFTVKRQCNWVDRGETVKTTHSILIRSLLCIECTSYVHRSTFNIPSIHSLDEAGENERANESLTIRSLHTDPNTASGKITFWRGVLRLNLKNWNSRKSFFFISIERWTYTSALQWLQRSAKERKRQGNRKTCSAVRSFAICEFCWFRWLESHALFNGDIGEMSVNCFCSAKSDCLRSMPVAHCVRWNWNG